MKHSFTSIFIHGQSASNSWLSDPRTYNQIMWELEYEWTQRCLLSWIPALSTGRVLTSQSGLCKVLWYKMSLSEMCPLPSLYTVLPALLAQTYIQHVLGNDIMVNNGSHLLCWSHKIILSKDVIAMLVCVNMFYNVHMMTKLSNASWKHISVVRWSMTVLWKNTELQNRKSM
jgi:hypothetical protein